MKQLVRDWPTVDRVHIEWIYDFVVKQPEEAMELMNSGKLDNQSEHPHCQQQVEKMLQEMKQQQEEWTTSSAPETSS